MKILKIFGIVAGIHLAIFLAAFVVPGCSSTTKPPPEPTETVAKSEPAPMITVPNAAAPAVDSGIGAPAPIAFNPDAPATYAGGSAGSGGSRFTPTRPNTAAASAVLEQPVPDVIPAATYSVKSGDSLWTIAKRNHLSVSELASANNLKSSSVLHQGQKLIIPAKAGAPSHASRAPSATAVSSTPAETHAKSIDQGTGAAPRSSDKTVSYTVKSGETLGQIARMFDVKSREIALANNITDPRNLRAGTVLIIPGGGWKSTSGRSAHSSATSSGSASSSAPATPAPQPSSPPDILAPDQGQQQQPPPSNNVPVIKIDDNSSNPEPKP